MINPKVAFKIFFFAQEIIVTNGEFPFNHNISIEISSEPVTNNVILEAELKFKNKLQDQVKCHFFSSRTV